MKIVITCLLILSINHNLFSQMHDFGSDGLSGLSNEQKENLVKEEIIVGFSDVIKGEDKNKIIEATVIFNTTPDAVWKLLSKTEDQPLYLDDCKTIKSISRNKEKAVEVHTAGNWLINLEYGVIEYFYPLNYSLYWTLDKSFSGNSLDAMKGYWQLYPYGKNKTLGRYENSISLKNVPEFAENIFKKNGVKDAMVSIKKYIDSGGFYRK